VYYLERVAILIITLKVGEKNYIVNSGLITNTYM